MLGPTSTTPAFSSFDAKANPDLLKEQADLLESILQVESIIAEKAKQILA